MIIEIDVTSKRAPFLQIKLAIMMAIGDGQLEPGDLLPPIRQLAGDLGVANNTVARAYRELEIDGAVGGKGRRGTVVLAPTPIADHDPTADEVRALVSRARRRGVNASTLLELVSAALAVE